MTLPHRIAVRRAQCASWAPAARPALSGTSAGFTLVEILVALAVLAVLASFAWRATSALVDGEARLAAEAKRWQSVDALFARIEGDAAAAIPRPVRVPGGREAAWIGTIDANGQSGFAFTRAGSEAEGPAALPARIAWRLAGSVVEVAYWPHLDRDAGATPARYAVLDGVARMAVRYADDDGAWSDRWAPQDGRMLPRAIAVALTLADGNRVERVMVLR